MDRVLTVKAAVSAVTKRKPVCMQPPQQDQNQHQDLLRAQHTAAAEEGRVQRATKGGEKGSLTSTQKIPECPKRSLFGTTYSFLEVTGDYLTLLAYDPDLMTHRLEAAYCPLKCVRVCTSRSRTVCLCMPLAASSGRWGFRHKTTAAAAVSTYPRFKLIDRFR